MVYVSLGMYCGTTMTFPKIHLKIEHLSWYKMYQRLVTFFRDHKHALMHVPTCSDFLPFALRTFTMSVAKMKMLKGLVQVQSNHDKAGYFLPLSHSSAITKSHWTLKTSKKVYITLAIHKHYIFQSAQAKSCIIYGWREGGKEGSAVLPVCCYLFCLVPVAQSQGPWGEECAALVARAPRPPAAGSVPKNCL